MSTSINSAYIPPPNNEVWVSNNDVSNKLVHVTSRDTAYDISGYSIHLTHQYLEEHYHTTLDEVIDLIKTAYPERLL